VAALATGACAHGGGDDGSGPSDDGGGQDTSVAPPDGSTRDSAPPRDTSTGDAAADVGTIEDSKAGDDATTDSGAPTGPDTGTDTGVDIDTGIDTGMDTGVDTGTDTGVPVHDSGTETSTNLPTCVAAYDQSNCEGYLSGTTQVSNNSHNWLCEVNCQNCAASTDCAPGHSNCPWGSVWTDKGECH
jgi:hypothetical protein